MDIVDLSSECDYGSAGMVRIWLISHELQLDSEGSEDLNEILAFKEGRVSRLLTQGLDNHCL